MSLRGSGTCESRIRRVAHSLPECRTWPGSANHTRMLWLRPYRCRRERRKERLAPSRTTSESSYPSSCRMRTLRCSNLVGSRARYLSRLWKRAPESHPASSNCATMNQSTQGKCPKCKSPPAPAATIPLAGQTCQRRCAGTRGCGTQPR